MAKTYHQTPNPEFRSSGDFLDYLDSTKLAPGWNLKADSEDSSRFPDSHVRERGNRWDAGADWETSLRLARFGWPDGLKKMLSGMEVLRIEGKSRTRINDVCGDFPNVGRFLSGMPNCMSRRVVQDGLRRPIIRIDINCTYSASVRSERIINLGAGIATVIDEIESSGYRVEVVVYYLSKMDGKHVGPSVIIKHADQALNMADLIFYMAHPTALRRLAFAHWETVISASEMPYGYGSVSNREYTKAQQEDKNLVAIDSLNSAALSDNSETPEKAYNWVREYVIKHNPLLFPEDQKQAA